MYPFNGEVLHQHLAGEEMNRQRADVQRTLDVLRALLLGRLARRRTEIDSERHDHRGGQQRDCQGQGKTGVADNAAAAQTLEELHWITTSSAPASTDIPSRA